MELAFQSFAIRKMCEDQNYAESILARDVARLLRTYVADLRAANAMTDFISLYSPTIDADRFSVPLSKSQGLLGCQGHIHSPLLDGAVDWSKVYRVRILSIGGGDA